MIALRQVLLDVRLTQSENRPVGNSSATRGGVGPSASSPRPPPNLRSFFDFVALTDFFGLHYRGVRRFILVTARSSTGPIASFRQQRLQG